MDFTLDQLQAFIVKAQAPHAFGTAKVTKGEADGAWTIIETDGDFKMVDKWFGGEPYGGQEVNHSNSHLKINHFVGQMSIPRVI